MFQIITVIILQLQRPNLSKDEAENEADISNSSTNRENSQKSNVGNPYTHT